MPVAGMQIETFFIIPVAVAAFLVLLTIIVFFHEYGHFSVARLLGVRVDVFSIGFGKTLWRWVDRKGTEWRVALLPLGGYVKFFGDLNAASEARPEIANETGPKQGKNEPHPVTTQFPRPGHEEEVARALTPEERKVCFHFNPVWARAAIVAAGPIANFVLAIAIFWALLTGFGQVVYEPRVATVEPGSAAAEAGFTRGDLIQEINGRPVRSFQDLSLKVKLSAGEALEFTVLREDDEVILTAAPKREEMPDRYGNVISVGKLGVGADPNAVAFVRYGPLEALGEASAQVWSILANTVKFLGRLILGKEDARQLGGPLKMAQYAGQSVMSGFDESGYVSPPSFVQKLKVSLVDFISLAAVISVSIGFLNLLPIPVLDGGHLMYYGYEAVAGKPLGARAQAIGFRVGIVFLASLMLFVTWNDINHLLSSNS
ncbi:MAG: RIP metalloprotease [Parvularculaceae bacterium]